MSANRIAIVACYLVTLSGGPGYGPRTAGSPQSSASTSAVRPAPNDSKPKANFKLVGMGEIETEYGVHLGFTNFETPDGVGLTLFYLAQDDPVRATQAFNEELARAVKVIERAPNRERTGNVVGERARILAPSTIPIPPFPAVAGPQLPAVVWTNGPTFHEIKSTSLRHVLEFEKVYHY